MNADIDISDITLHTERLTLRPWTENDLKDFYEYASVEGVGEQAGWLHHKDIDETRAVLNRFIDGKRTFAIVFNGKVIGSLGVELYKEDELPEFNEKRGRELGFVLSKDFWGMGLMPEAVRAVIKYLFETVKLDFIACSHYVENTRSMRVQEKCGFKHYKKLKHATRWGELKDSWTSILER